MPSEMRIAVVIPVYNVAPYLKRCLDSVCVAAEKLNTIVDLDLRPRPSLEIICVDDGSTDGSGTMLDAYADEVEKRGGGGQRTVSSDDVAERIPCLRVIHQPNAGLSAARNTALDLLERERSATHVTFIDSDDWVAPNYLVELARGLADGAEISAVRCVRTSEDRMNWNADGKIVWQTVSPRAYWAVDDNNHSAAWGKLYAIRLFEGIRYPVGKINEDEYTTYRVFFRADKVAFTNGELYAYYVRPDSIMNARWSPKRLDRLQAWRDQIAFFGEHGYGELVANSRKWLTVDLVEAIRNLVKGGDRDQAKSLRRELAGQLKVGRMGIREFYLAHKTAHPLRTRLWQLTHTKHQDEKCAYSCIFDTPYALSLYLLYMTEEQVERTMFYAGEHISSDIVARLPHATVISIMAYRRWYQLRLACLWRNLSELRGTEIFAQDHLMFASQLLCWSKYTYLEDSPGIYKVSECFKFEHGDESTWWRRLVAWWKFGSVRHHYIGQNAQCVNRLVSDPRDVDAAILKDRRYELIDLRGLWNRASNAKRSRIAWILTGADSVEEIKICEGHRVILLSQPMMQDCGLSLDEMKEVYAPALDAYRDQGVIVKPHPRDRFPFKEVFPWVDILDTAIPMQILSAMGVKFDIAITICSTSISSFGPETKICWIGTAVNSKIHKVYGDRKPSSECRNVELFEESTERKKHDQGIDTGSLRI